MSLAHFASLLLLGGVRFDWFDGDGRADQWLHFDHL